MTRSEMIRAVDAEIRRLEAIRDQLRALTSHASLLPRKRMLSDDGRRRIVEAQHRRWASVRAAANPA